MRSSEGDRFAHFVVAHLLELCLRAPAHLLKAHIEAVAAFFYAPRELHACTRACLQIKAHVCAFTCVYGHARACVRECMHACVYACMHARACVRACTRMCASVCVSACMIASWACAGTRLSAASGATVLNQSNTFFQ